MSAGLEGITFADSAVGVDWAEAKADLVADDFDNGRTPEQLATSFDNSYSVGFAFAGSRCVSMARLIGDGVCNAYLIDVWTLTPYRRRGIASEIVKRLLATVPGHHVVLFTEHEADLYRELGFKEEHVGMSTVVGTWLQPG